MNDVEATRLAVEQLSSQLSKYFRDTKNLGLCTEMSEIPTQFIQYFQPNH